MPRRINVAIADAEISAANPMPVSGVTADGADVTLGALADAAVQDAAGSVNAHLRGAVVDLLAILARLGEVQASPTANTLLARIKALETLLNGGLPAALTAGGGMKTGVVDALPAGTNMIGNVGWNFPTTQPISEAIINIASAGDNTIVAGAALQTIRVYGLFFVCSSPVTVTLKSGAGTAKTGAMSFLASGGMVLDPLPIPRFITTAGDGFVINLSGAVQVSGRILYSQS